MTVPEFLREAQAAHSARTTYNRAADRLFRKAYLQAVVHDPRATETATLARRLRRAAGNEYDGHRSSR